MHHDRSSVALTDRVRAWMFDKALPFWAETGVDIEGGGFVEHLDLDGRPAKVNFKRTRVQARQIYVFSHAHVMGWRDGAAVARRGVEFLIENARLDGGGWARTLDRAGEVLDPELDLYDQAFVIYALAWWFKATGDERAPRLARETLDAIKRRLRREDGQGYHAFTPHPDEFQQNPHMHLLEASIAWADCAGDERFADEAHALADLLTMRLFNPRTGALTEYFNEDLTPRPGVRGRLVEPGHHFEWSWLLYCCGRVTGRDFREHARALFEFAEKYGVDPCTGLTYDELIDDGSVHSADSRSWPQTETLKAHLARLEFEGVCGHTRIRQISENLFDRYLNRDPQGIWTDHLRADGTHRVDRVPASTFYHLFLAFSELLRVYGLTQS